VYFEQFQYSENSVTKDSATCKLGRKKKEMVLIVDIIKYMMDFLMLSIKTRGSGASLPA